MGGGGNGIEVFLGGGEKPLDGRSARQQIPIAGVMRFGDFVGDGPLDFAIFDPHHFNIPMQLG